LKKNKITGNAKISDNSYKNILAQKPNRKFLFFSLYEWFYHTGLKKYDTAKLNQEIIDIQQEFDSKIESQKENEKKVKKLRRKKARKVEKIRKKLRDGNLFMRWGEPVEIYDSAKTDRSMLTLNRFLESRGFFEYKTRNRVKIRRKKVKVVYRIKEGRAHKIDTVYYESFTDERISSILQNNKKDQLIERGDNFNEQKIENERSRISDLLKYRRYYDFNKQFVFANDAMNSNPHVA
jgi:hypothetical protein